MDDIGFRLHLLGVGVRVLISYAVCIVNRAPGFTNTLK